MTNRYIHVRESIRQDAVQWFRVDFSWEGHGTFEDIVDNKNTADSSGVQDLWSQPNGWFRGGLQNGRFGVDKRDRTADLLNAIGF